MKELLLHFKVLCVVFVSYSHWDFLNDVDIFMNTCMTINVDLDDKLFYMSNSEGLQRLEGFNYVIVHMQFYTMRLFNIRVCKGTFFNY